jgi:hypothetical protein
MNTTKEFSDEEILSTPVADGAAIFFCPNPDCNLPHVLMIDEDGDPIAHYVIDDDFFTALTAAMQRRKNQ